MTKKLEVSDLVFDYENRKILNHLDFSVNEGEFVSILGPSGCGKSTLLKLLTGVLKAEKGHILVDGQEIKGVTEHFAYMPQNDLLFSWKTILENVCLYGRIHGSADGMKEQARKQMEAFGLKGYEDEYPSSLSGGMRQRCVMAIALAADPDILFADEPTTALDVTIQAQILDLLREIQRKLGTATILVSHDLGVVARVADRVAVMYAGKIVEIGTAEEVYYDPRHPYTWGLMRSLPAFANGKESLYTIPDMPPTLIDPPEGDAFACRNEYALNIDYEEMPPMFKITDTHYAATWLLDPRAPQIKSPVGGIVHE